MAHEVSKAVTYEGERGGENYSHRENQRINYSPVGFCTATKLTYRYRITFYQS